MADKDDRPECKYGEKCYRTSEEHVSKFKHSKRQKKEDEAPKLTKRKSTESEIGNQPKKKTKIDDFFQRVPPKNPQETATTIEDFMKKPEEEDSVKTINTEEQEEKQSTSDTKTEETVEGSHGNSSGYVRDSSSDQTDTSHGNSSGYIRHQQSSDGKNISTENCDDDDDDDGNSDLAAADMDPKLSIKDKFLVEMPTDFYDMWDLCKKLNPLKPESAFLESGLELVGPYDVLAGKCKQSIDNKKYLIHWRYYYDPPEFLTVIKGDDKSMFHIGYFRDDPKEMPVFLASNCAARDGSITPRGENIFAAIAWHLGEQYQKTKSKSLGKLVEEVKDFATERTYSLDLKTPKMKERNKKVVCKTFHGAGLVVPVDENDVGYRPVPETPGDLKKLFKRIIESKTDTERNRNLDELQEIITLIHFANDECDYGEGLELGLDLFTYGGAQLHSFIMTLLPLGYKLTERTEYQQIIVEHLKDRRQTAKLSVLK